jgi:serine/threonine-protein kinase RsbW
MALINHRNYRGIARCDIRAVIPATLEAVEQLFMQFRRGCSCAYQPGDCFTAELLLREAVTNAVVHGIGTAPVATVACAMRMKGRRLIIAVEDEGAGFDWRAARDHEVDASSCSGRGMEILRKYATRVRFNEKGNAVTIIKDFDREFSQ